MSLAIIQTVTSYEIPQIPQTPNVEILLAPRTLTGGSHSRFVHCLWGQRSHLCPDLQHRSRRPQSATIPTCYWLLLLLGDVERNPGPVCCLCASSRSPSEVNRHILPSGSEAAKLNCLEGTDDDLVINHLNVRSLVPKKDEVQLFLQEHKCAHVLGLSETWLNDNIPTGELAVAGFSSHRRDRGSGRGGGLLVYVSECVTSIRRSDLEDTDLEILWIEVKLRKTNLLICNVYRPPDAKASWMDSMVVMVEKAVAEKAPVVIMGDFNCDMLLNDSKCVKLEDMTSDYGLVQMVREPTRVTQTSRTQIDLMFTTDDIGAVLDRVGCLELGLSDHSLIYGVVTGCGKRGVNTMTLVHCFSKCNLERLVAELDAAPWHDGVMEALDDMDSKWDYWKMLFWKIVDSHVPLKKARVRVKTLPWITRELRVLMRTRNYHCKKAKKTGSEEDWKHYKELRNKVTLELRKAKLQYFRALSESQSANKTKKTWTEINRLLGGKGRGGVETLRRDTHAEVLTDEQAIAEEFGDFFSSIVRMTNDGNPREVMYNVCGLLKACDSSFKFSEIGEEDVLKLLKVLDPNKAIGVDKISGKLFCMTACGISQEFDFIV